MTEEMRSLARGAGRIGAYPRSTEAARVANFSRVSRRGGAVFVLASIIAVACDAERPKIPATEQQQEPALIAPAPQVASRWMRHPPGQWNLLDPSQRIPKTCARDVAPSSIDKAVRLLMNAPWKVLSKEEAIALTDHAFDFEVLDSGVPILLRGVGREHSDVPDDRTSEEDHRYVGFKDGVVEVVRAGIRFKPLPFRPFPLVAVLPTVPTDLFVGAQYSIGERGDGASDGLPH